MDYLDNAPAARAPPGMEAHVRLPRGIRGGDSQNPKVAVEGLRESVEGATSLLNSLEVADC